MIRMIRELLALGFRRVADKLDAETQPAPAAIIDRAGYDGPVVTPEAEALRAPRVPRFDIPPAPPAPLAGSLEDREQRARRR